MGGMRSGSKVYVDTGYGTFRELVLGEMVGGDGAVGTVYHVSGSPRECIKVFHDNSARVTTVVRFPKIREIIDKYEQGEINGFATLPKSIVYENPDANSPIGYLMDYFDGVPLSDLAYSAGESVDFHTRLLAARGLAECVAHAHGVTSDPVTRHIVIGDLSLANALYQPDTGNVRVVDVDSFQIVGRTNNKTVLYPVTEMRSATYETVRADRPLGKFALTSRSDNVLLAECVFRLLIQCDPLDDLSLEDVDFDEERNEAIADRHYPYIESMCKPVVQPESVVGDELAGLFIRSFSGPYENVPTAQEYRDAIQRLIDSLSFSKNDWFEIDRNKLRDSSIANLSGGTVLRNTSYASPISDGDAWASVSEDGLRRMVPKRYRRKTKTSMSLASVLAERVVAFAPWLVLFLLALYHITSFLPLGIVPFIQSFLRSHTTIVAMLFSIVFIAAERLIDKESRGIGLKVITIISMLIIGLLCPSVSGGYQIVKTDVMQLLVRLGAL